MKKEKSPADMYEEKRKEIREYVSAKDLNIRLSWAINNAVQILVPTVVHLIEAGDTVEKAKDNVREDIGEWMDYFLELFDEKMGELKEKNIPVCSICAGKLVGKSEPEFVCEVCRVHEQFKLKDLKAEE